MSQDDIQNLCTVSTTTLISYEEKVLAQKQSTRASALSLPELIEYSQALLWYLTVQLGVPRTNSMFVQWQLGSTLQYLSDAGQEVPWDTSPDLSGNWVFVPHHIKNQFHPSRSVFDQVMLPKSLNRWIHFYLRYVRPSLWRAASAEVTDDSANEGSDQSWFWLNSKGKSMSGITRRNWTSEWMQTHLGRSVTIMNLRLCYGTHLSRDTTLSPAEKAAMIKLMDHSEATHNMYYNCPPLRSEQDQREVAPAFVRKWFT